MAHEENEQGSEAGIAEQHRVGVGLLVEHAAVEGHDGGHGVEEEILLHDRGHHAHRVEDGRQVEPGHHEDLYDIAYVPRLRIDGAYDQGESQGEDELDRDDEGEKERVVGHGDLEHRKEREEQCQGEEKGDEVGEDHGERDRFARKGDVFYEVGAVDEGADGGVYRSVEPVPGEEGAEQEGGEVAPRHLDADDHGEDDREEAHEKQRAHDRPEEAEGGDPVANLEVLDRQGVDELSVGVELSCGP